MRKSLVLGLVFCILGGCSHKKEKADLPVIALDCNQLSSIHDWGVLDRLEIVRLDSEEALFGDIDRIVRYKDRIYLMDANKTRTVYIYDLSGKYINKISKYGQGPDEYLQLADLYIDPTDASLNVATRIDRKIMKFDLDGKQLRKVIGTPKAFTRLTQFKDRYVGYMGNYIQDCENPYNVWVLSEKMETKQKTFMIPASWNSFDLGSRYPFSSFQSDFYYTKALDYTVYQMDEADGSFFPKYRFDLGDRSWPEDAKMLNHTKNCGGVIRSVNMWLVSEGFRKRNITCWLLSSLTGNRSWAFTTKRRVKAVSFLWILIRMSI